MSTCLHMLRWSMGEQKRQTEEILLIDVVKNDIDLFKIFQFRQYEVRELIVFKISSILLMRRDSTEPGDSPKNGRPLTRAIKAQLEVAQRNDCRSLREALVTLDNQESFNLLKGFENLSQDLLCQRAFLAHQLHQHNRCLEFSRRALSSLPRCRPCLQVYLSHVNEIPAEELSSLNEELLLAIQQFGGRLIESLPKLMERSPNCTRYFNLVQVLKSSGSAIASYRKMIATSQIQKNQQLLFIPNSQLITLELCRTLPLVQKMLTGKVFLRSPKHTHLAIFLLLHFEIGSQSPFYQYISTLPTDFSSFPFKYSEELLKELKGTHFLDMLEHKKAEMRKDYDAVVTCDQNFRRFPFDKFCQVRMLVSSRVFGIVVNQVKTDALVPVADMLNHRIPKQTSWYYCDKLGGFVVEALRDISQGSEVFDSYGQKCNSRFLLSYGFVQPKNTHNEVIIDVNLVHPVDGAPKAVKIRISRCLQSRGFLEMMSLLRATIDPETLKQQQQQQLPLTLQILKQTSFKSKENEAKVWRTLEAIMTERLRAYPSTTIEDKRLLAECRDMNMKNVIILRLGQKQILAFYQTMSKVMARFLMNEGRRGELWEYRVYLESIGLWKDE